MPVLSLPPVLQTKTLKRQPRSVVFQQNRPGAAVHRQPVRLAEAGSNDRNLSAHFRNFKSCGVTLNLQFLFIPVVNIPFASKQV
jgi:hypothetical protein